MTLWSKELMKGMMQSFLEEKKGHIFFIFVIFHIRKVPCLLKPSLWTSTSSYFDSVCFRQCRRLWDTLSLLILVILFNKSCFLCDLNQVFFNRIRCFSSAKCFYFVVILDAMFSVYSNPHHPIISRQTKKHWIQIILFWNVQYSTLNQENSRTMKVCNN